MAQQTSPLGHAAALKQGKPAGTPGAPLDDEPPPKNGPPGLTTLPLLLPELPAPLEEELPRPTDPDDVLPAPMDPDEALPWPEARARCAGVCSRVAVDDLDAAAASGQHDE